VRAFKILVDLSAFPLVIFVCSTTLNIGSRASPRILGFVTVIVMVYLCFLTVGMVVLFIVKLRFVSSTSGSGVKSVAVL